MILKGKRCAQEHLPLKLTKILFCGKLFFEDLAEFHVFFKGEASPQKSPPSKKKGYRLTAETKALLDADTTNSKLWTEVTTALQDYPVSIVLLRHASKLS